MGSRHNNEYSRIYLVIPDPPCPWRDQLNWCRLSHDNSVATCTTGQNRDGAVMAQWWCNCVFHLAPLLQWWRSCQGTNITQRWSQGHWWGINDWDTAMVWWWHRDGCHRIIGKWRLGAWRPWYRWVAIKAKYNRQATAVLPTPKETIQLCGTMECNGFIILQCGCSQESCGLFMMMLMVVVYDDASSDIQW